MGHNMEGRLLQCTRQAWGWGGGGGHPHRLAPSPTPPLAPGSRGARQLCCHISDGLRSPCPTPDAHNPCKARSNLTAWERIQSMSTWSTVRWTSYCPSLCSVAWRMAARYGRRPASLRRAPHFASAFPAGLGGSVERMQQAAAVAVYTNAQQQLGAARAGWASGPFRAACNRTPTPLKDCWGRGER